MTYSHSLQMIMITWLIYDVARLHRIRCKWWWQIDWYPTKGQPLFLLARWSISTFLQAYTCLSFFIAIRILCSTPDLIFLPWLKATFLTAAIIGFLLRCKFCAALLTWYSWVDFYLDANFIFFIFLLFLLLPSPSIHNFVGHGFSHINAIFHVVLHFYLKYPWQNYSRYQHSALDFFYWSTTRTRNLTSK